jgi:hypothetical protein
VITILSGLWFHGLPASGDTPGCSAFASTRGTPDAGVLLCSGPCGVGDADPCAHADQALLTGTPFEVPPPGLTAHTVPPANLGDRDFRREDAGEPEQFPAVHVYLWNESFRC